MKTLVKSISVGMSLWLSLSCANAFDFQMPEEEAPQNEEAAPEVEAPSEEPVKKTKSKLKKAKKVKSKAVKKAHKIKKAAIKKVHHVAHRHESRNVQDQIRLLHQRMDQLEGNSTAHTAFANSATMDGKKEKEGFVYIKGGDTTFKLGGYVKIDAIYDANQYTGTDSNVPNLLLKNLDAGASQSNVFTAHAKQTRLILGSETNTSRGQLITYFEGDFFGTTNFGTSNGSFSRASSSSLNSYNFRVRHAYGSYIHDKAHRLDVGQMWTLFYDPKSTGTTVEFNGPETTAQIRRPQIRYGFTHKQWKFSGSLESGATEYLDISPTFVGNAAAGGANPVLTAGSPSSTYNTSQYRRSQSSFLGGVSGDGVQGLPDIVAQAQYENKGHEHIFVAGMLRQLCIKKTITTGANDPAFSRKKYGYGIALGGRKYIGNTNVFAQLNFGKGIGTYIFGLNGYAAAVDASRGMMQTQFAYGALIGLEHYWTENLRTNLIYSQARANVSNIIPAGRVPVIGVDAANNLVTLATTGYSISSMLRQLYVNVLWSPLDKVELGLEYAFFRRDTINQYFGYGNRFQFGAYYKF